MENILLGAIIGVVLSYVVGGMWIRNYKSTLLLCSKAGTPEKLGREFFYIVPEHEYIRIKQEASVQVQRRALTEILGKRITPPSSHA